MKKITSNPKFGAFQIDDCALPFHVANDQPGAPEGHSLTPVYVISLLNQRTGSLVTAVLSDFPNLDAGAIRAMVAHNDADDHAGLPSTGFHFENGTWTKEAR